MVIYSCEGPLSMQYRENTSSKFTLNSEKMILALVSFLLIMTKLVIPVSKGLNNHRSIQTKQKTAAGSSLTECFRKRLSLQIVEHFIKHINACYNIIRKIC